MNAKKSQSKSQRNVCGGDAKKVEIEKKKNITRLKKIEGQVRGLQKMISEDRYCIDVITQTSAVRNALRSFEDAVLKDHLGSCAMHQMQSDNKGEQQKAVDEILKVYRLKK